MQRPQIVIQGTTLRPVLHVTFDIGDTEADAWVRALPERHWDGAGRHWVVTAIGDATVPDNFLVVGRDGLRYDIYDFVKPIAAQSDHDTYATFVHPRLWGRDKVRSRVGADSLWRDDVCLSRPEHVTADWCLDAPRNAPTPEPTPPSNISPLRFDGTIDGLRGVPLVDLKSVSGDSAMAFYAMGIENVYDLLHTVPRRYIDMSNPLPIASTSVGEKVAIVGNVVKVVKPNHKGGMGRATIEDAHKTRIYCRWFNAGWAVRRLTEGDNVLIYGTVEEFATDSGFKGRAMTNPMLEMLDRSHSQGVIGVYPASAKHELTTWQSYNAANEAARRLGDMADTIPQDILDSHGLMSRTDAFKAVHNPQSLEEAQRGRDRLAYDELLRLQLALLVARAQHGQERGIAYNGDGHLVEQLVNSLPFDFTADQQAAIDDILRDGLSMQAGSRVLQGEVGSGKTIVSAIGMLNAVEAGHQAAMVAPTEILANQHYEDISDKLEGIVHRTGRDLNVALLTNKVTGKARKAVLAGLADGTIDIVVGTQALFADAVEFESLALVVVDEQHRFGVEQRNSMKSKGSKGRLPDLIYASATPIPRTALMTVFGDLDTSIIKTMPPGRIPVATAHHETAPLGDRWHPVWAHIRSEVEAGHQAFVVCPMVTESLVKEAAAATQTAEQLSTGALAGLRIGVVTGKQKPDERHEVMGQFERGELDVLVATTVIEVGVNVPNATAMVILGADRFGIAQLHQLRGRVGRGQWPGTCYLVAQPRTSTGEQRIQALVDSTNGFELSELDLAIRGAGSILGADQSGTARDMRVADILNDVELVNWAKADAKMLTDGDPKLDRSPALRAEFSRALGPDAAEWLTSA